MTEDLLSQLANPKKNGFELQKKEEIKQDGFAQSVLPVEAIKEAPKQEAQNTTVAVKPVETKPLEIKSDNQLADVKKVEDIFKRIINNDKSRR